MNMPIRRALLLAGCTAALAVALSGCGTGDVNPDAARPDPAVSTATSTTDDSSAMKVGDCLVEAATGLPEDAEVVPCTEPHDEQVFHKFPLKDESFSAEAVEAATQDCVGDAFTAFIGVSKAESSLGVYVVSPTSETWDQPGARTVTCIVTDPTGQIAETLEGSAR